MALKFLCSLAAASLLALAGCATASQSTPAEASDNSTRSSSVIADDSAFPAKLISFGAWDDHPPAATNVAVLQIETQTKRVVVGRLRVTILNGLAIPHGTFLTNDTRAKWEWVVLPAGEAVVSCRLEEYYHRAFRWVEPSAILSFDAGFLYRLALPDKSDNFTGIILQKIGPANFGPNSPYLPAARDAVR